MKKIRFILSIVWLVMLGVFATTAEAQQSKGGVPPTFLVKEAQALPTQAYVKMPINFNIQELKAEDVYNAKNGINRPRVAKVIPADITMENSGAWSQLPDGRNVWRVAIEATGAKAIILGYDDFYIPAGAQLFLYNKEKTQVLGAFDNTTNPKGTAFSTSFVAGDVAFLEYVAPAMETGDKARIKISTVGFGYNHLHVVNVPTDNVLNVSPGASQSCQVNVVCSPEGDVWQENSKAVVQMTMLVTSEGGWFICTGSLINNTANDKKPYIISAYHCYEGATASDLLQWQFNFFFESATCTPNTGYSNYEQLVGALLRVAVPMSGGSDGLLLELTSQIPDAWVNDGKIYWTGWDRRGDPSVAAQSGVCIHHPKGDVKKIATYTAPATVAGNINFGQYTGTNSHWDVYFVQTPNGWSRSEGGSSGSGLLNQDHKLIGTLSGGPSLPNNLGQPCGREDEIEPESYFGRLYAHWDQYGTGPSTQMKTWLDPLNTGVETLDGLPNSLDLSFVGTPTNIYATQSVKFTSSILNGTSYNWEFTGGTPATSTEATPTIEYDTPGVYGVKLTVKAPKPDGSGDTILPTLEKTNYITVTVKGTPTAPIANVAVLDEIGTIIPADDASTSTIGTTGAETYMRDSVAGTYSASHKDHLWFRTNTGVSSRPAASGASGSGDYYYAFYCPQSASSGLIYRMYNNTPYNLSAVTRAQLKFKCVSLWWEPDFDALDVEYRESSTAEWKTLLTIDENTFLDMDDEVDLDKVGKWLEYSVALPNLSSTYQIAFKATAKYGRGIGIDDIEIVEAGASPVPDTIWEGDNIDFYDFSSGTPVLYKYTFEGGTPETSTDTVSPINVTYNTEGEYDIKQWVRNTIGEDSITRTDYVYVIGRHLNALDNAATVDVDTIFSNGGAINEPIVLLANRSWTAIAPGFVSLSVASGTITTVGNDEQFPITVTAAAYTPGEVRQGYIVFTTDDGIKVDSVLVIQGEPAVPVANVAALDYATSVYGPDDASSSTVGTYASATYKRELVSGASLTSSMWTRTTSVPVSGGASGSSDYYFGFDGSSASARMYNNVGIDLSTAGHAKLKFKYVSSEYNFLGLIVLLDKMAVQYRTSPTAEWQTLMTITDNTNEEWVEYSVELPNIDWSSTYQIGFLGTALGGNGLGVDDIEIVAGNPLPNVILWEGENVDMYDLATGTPAEYRYKFDGGTPATSTSNSSPINVVYNTKGVYDVSQWVKNVQGEDSITRTDYVTVYGREISVDTDSVTSECGAAATQNIVLTTNHDWVATVPSWVTLSQTSGTVTTPGTSQTFPITLSFAANASGAGHNDFVKFSTSDGVLSTQVAVMQSTVAPSNMVVARYDSVNAKVTWNAVPGSYQFAYTTITAGYGGFEPSQPQVVWKSFTKGEGPGWEVFSSASLAHGSSPADTSFMRSMSYENNVGAYDADDWLVTPQIEVTATDHIFSYYISSQDANYPDSYELKLSTLDAVGDITDFTVVLKAMANAPTGPTTAPDNKFVQETVDLSAYIGQKVYIAFHHVGNDNYWLKLDDIGGVMLATRAPATTHSAAAQPRQMLSLNNAVIEHKVIRTRSQEELERDAERQKTAANLLASTGAPKMQMKRINALQSSNVSNELQSSLSGAGMQLRWCGGYEGNGIGASGTPFVAAAHWTASEAAQYAGQTLRAVGIAMNEAVDIDIVIFGGSNGQTQLYSQHVSASEITAGEETVIPLTTPFAISGTDDIWLGYLLPDGYTGYPAGCDEGPRVAGKGNMVLWQEDDGSWAWYLLTDLGDLDYNWYIVGYTDYITNGYKLYRMREGGAPEIIADGLTDTSYNDENITPGGEYCYWVTYTSNSMTSCPSDTACAFILYSQEIKPIANIVKQYGAPAFKLDANGTDVEVRSTAADYDYFATRGVPVTLDVLSGTSVSLSGVPGDYTATINSIGTTHVRATQPGIVDTLLTADTVEFDIIVNVADLYIRAVDASREEGQPNPTFELVYETLLYGDTPGNFGVTVTPVCNANTLSPQGKYPIFVTVSGSNPNYNIITVDGTLTVTETSKIINAITPYELDGYNDKFMPGHRMKIFNRYGVLIFETKNEKEAENGWDGRFQNHNVMVEPGVYYYVLYSAEGKVERRGSITVVKK